ncbi:rab-GTPase-TBC domain-containing protein [Polychytrium aggregatum]|uniref:rab-GTPase-TBC domain-containing protein n=1 Tax=Polychytrium aggregatum TaxID=110093 RepID=UPI0022FE720B|nr:rab-GTPase-TBC domain-containing protein [Polychytrium aggregatum]KAI9203443.1 rab-GTPase-TBC domain-containing protein [Polychytrium aggregatum]
MEGFKERLALFERLITPYRPELSAEEFRQECFNGIPDKPVLRSKSWKILLNYLPYDERARWGEILFQKRSLYYSFLRELITDPAADESIAALVSKADDHPLNNALDSRWKTYFQDNVMLEQIDKDVRRTLPDLAFFQQPVPASLFSPLSPNYGGSIIDPSDLFWISCSASMSLDALPPVPAIDNRRCLFKRLGHCYADDEFGSRSHARQTTPLQDAPRDPSSEMIGDPLQSQTHLQDPDADLHWEANERILFIYAKLNPGVGYIQGMNELLAPIYYVMAHDSEESRAHAEADSFFLFTALMSEFRDHFIRSLDNVQESMSPSSASPSSKRASISEVSMEQASGNGIGNSMSRLMRRLRKRDPVLHKDFERKNIHPAFFAFRWLTVLLTQEFPLPDTLRIWDSILADLALDLAEKTSTPTKSLADLSDEYEIVRVGPNLIREGRFDFLIDFCCAMLICIRDDLLSNGFAENIKLLQHYPVVDINVILNKVNEFRENEWLVYQKSQELASVISTPTKVQDSPTKSRSPTKPDSAQPDIAPPLSGTAASRSRSGINWSAVLARHDNIKFAPPSATAAAPGEIRSTASLESKDTVPAPPGVPTTNFGQTGPESSSTVLQGVKKSLHGGWNSLFAAGKPVASATSQETPQGDSQESVSTQQQLAKGFAVFTKGIVAGSAVVSQAMGRLSTVVADALEPPTFPEEGGPLDEALSSKPPNPDGAETVFDADHAMNEAVHSAAVPDAQPIAEMQS